MNDSASNQIVEETDTNGQDMGRDRQEGRTKTIFKLLEVKNPKKDDEVASEKKEEALPVPGKKVKDKGGKAKETIKEKINDQDLQQMIKDRLDAFGEQPDGNGGQVKSSANSGQ